MADPKYADLPGIVSTGPLGSPRSRPRPPEDPLTDTGPRPFPPAALPPPRGLAPLLPTGRSTFRTVTRLGRAIGRSSWPSFRLSPVSWPRNLRVLTPVPESLCRVNTARAAPNLPIRARIPVSDTLSRPLGDGLHPAKEEVTVAEPSCAP